MLDHIKLIALLCALGSLAACGGGDNSSISGESSTSTGSSGSSSSGTSTNPVDNSSSSANVVLGTGTGSSFNANVASTAMGTGTLSAGGSTTVAVDMVDADNNNAAFLGIKSVKFDSVCAQAGLAEFSPDLLKAAGSATSVYQDKGCGREDTIYVYIVDTDSSGAETTGSTALVKLAVATPNVGSIAFVEATPNSIALKRVGSDVLPASSQVTFQVLDEDGNPMSAKTVTFALEKELGGASLSKSSTATDTEGKATVRINSGRVAGTISVIASIAVDSTTVISTQSTAIAMASDLADQNSFQISADLLNPAAWDINGTEVNISVYVGDHSQNPVLDGTRVLFTAEGGLIEPSCETISGRCTVKWVSANPRPIDGIARIVARTAGEGDYQDTNRNGYFDIGESFATHSEVFLDANDNGVFDPAADYNTEVDIDNDGSPEFFWNLSGYLDSLGSWAGSSNDYEEFFDFNNNGSFDSAPTKYQGGACSSAALAAGHCASLMDVSASLNLVMSSGASAFIDGPYIYNAATGRYDTPVTCIDVRSQNVTVMWRVFDSSVRKNKMAAGTTFRFDQTNVNVVADNAGTVGKFEAAVPRFSKWQNMLDYSQLPVPLTYGSQSAANQRYKYLNQRGHVVTATIARPESFTGADPYGYVVLGVDTVNGETIEVPLTVAAATDACL